MTTPTIYVQCDVELNVSGPTERVTVTWTANALRTIADQLERGSYGDGHHDVSDGSGKRIGSVYFDFSESVDW